MSTNINAFNYNASAQPVTGESINSIRRLYNFGERVAEINPIATPFFTYLTKVARKPTDDPVFKFMEQRHQWQRRYAIVVGQEAWSGGSKIIYVAAPYDQTGKVTCEDTDNITTGNVDKNPTFFLANQMVILRASNGTMCNFKISTVVQNGTVPTVSGNVFSGATNVCKITMSPNGATSLYDGLTVTVPTTSSPKQRTMVQVIGSAFAEGSTGPDSWYDRMSDREGYTQIFKTASPMMSGTAMATRMRGRANEWARIWKEKLEEHKIDIEHAMLFNNGRIDSANNIRYTWGIMPYVEQYGKVYEFNYGTANYDSFLDAMQDYFAPETGNSPKKLVMTSRKILNWMNKLGRGSYMSNTAGAGAYTFDIQNVTGKFGHKISAVDALFGDLMFVENPLFRNGYEDYAIAVDLANVAIRPLIGNGVNRDTFIETSVQDRKTDGREDLITTETGLEISLPETHAILKFS